MKTTISNKLNQIQMPIYTSIGMGLALALGVPESAWAISLSTAAGSVQGQFQSIADLLSGGAYLGGAGFGIKSALKFKEYNESQNGQVKLSQPITLGLVSGALLALPSFLTIGVDSAGLTSKNTLSKGVLGGAASGGGGGGAAKK